MAILSDVDQLIALEKNRRFWGCVKVPLDKLRREDSTRAPRQLSEAGVTRLVDRFKREGCLRREAQHYVPALISCHDLLSNDFRVDAVGNASGDDPRDPPVYCPQQPLVFLAGQHRLEAARRFLIPSEFVKAFAFSTSMCPSVRLVYVSSRNSGCECVLSAALLPFLQPTTAARVRTRTRLQTGPTVYRGSSLS